MRLSLRREVLTSLAVAAAVACGSGSHSSGFHDNGGGGPGSGDGGQAGDDGSTISVTGDDSGLMLGPGSKGDGGAGDSGTIPPTTTSIDRCTTGAATGLSSSAIAALLAGGSAGSLRYLYPYAETVFPRGLIAPTLMWDGGAADYVYVHIKSKLFEYKGCLKPTAAGQIALPQDVWVAAGAHAQGPSDPFALSLTVISGSTVTGPLTESIIIAPATLKGSLYYNTYSTKLLTGAGPMAGGAVLRVVPGQTAQVFLGQSGCNGCHAVSANGSRMVADPFTTSANGSGATYVLTQNGPVNPTPKVANATNATFVGVYPDGSLYVGNAHPNGFGGPRPGGPLATGPTSSGLFETDTGNAVSNSGIPAGAMMPTFSPDGKSLVFTDNAIASGGGMATMTFDKTSRTATAYKQIFQVTGSGTYPGWPFFLPDNSGVVFAIGTAADYSGSGIGIQGGITAGAPTSDLYVVVSASGSSMLLAKAMGFTTATNASSNTTYLPYGASEELHHNYYPTVSPVAAGGYFWVFFDSYRHYGNLGLQRQLWGTAVDVKSDGHYTADPSHPAFYVTGQELGTGNHRAFTALDPCQMNGTTCTTGVDCCGGYCTNGTCGVPVPRCSNIDEACGPGHACCDPSAQCINGFCEKPVIQ
jgi:hypothetical protein